VRRPVLKFVHRRRVCSVTAASDRKAIEGLPLEASGGNSPHDGINAPPGRPSSSCGMKMLG
jgi:hypothetical protein